MNVVIYSRTTCGPCKALKYWLNNRGIAFEERNLDNNPEYVKDVVEKSGVLMVPMTLVGDRVVSGFNIPSIAELLT